MGQATAYLFAREEWKSNYKRNPDGRDVTATEAPGSVFSAQVIRSWFKICVHPVSSGCYKHPIVKMRKYLVTTVSNKHALRSLAVSQ